MKISYQEVTKSWKPHEVDFMRDEELLDKMGTRNKNSYFCIDGIKLRLNLGKEKRVITKKIKTKSNIKAKNSNQINKGK